MHKFDNSIIKASKQTRPVFCSVFPPPRWGEGGNKGFAEREGGKKKKKGKFGKNLTIGSDK